jgi:predicted glycosyl hydrolase (DUF1957 family)
METEDYEFEPMKCLLIRANNQVEEIEISITDVNEVLKTEYTDNETLTYLMEHGYYCGVICKDIFEESDKINKIASLICKKAQSKGNWICGDVILMDNFKLLTKSNLSNIMRIAFDLDYNKWSRGINIKVKERLKELDEEINI